MGVLDWFKKSDQKEEYEAILPKVAKDYKDKPDEKTAAVFLKCLAKCEVYVPINIETIDNEEDKQYPFLRTISGKFVMMIYSNESEFTNEEKYQLVKMHINKCINLYYNVKKLGVERMILDENSLNVSLPDAFIRYIISRNTKKLI